MWVALCLGFVIGSFAQGYESLESGLNFDLPYRDVLDNAGNVDNTQKTNPDFPFLTVSDLKNVTDIENVIEKLNEIVRNQDDSDEDEYIERPCRVFDPECIRSYFAAHGHCKKVDGTVPEPLHRSASTGYLPRVNLTVTLVNVDYYGLNGQIVEFYINRKTNKLVLAVQMSNIVSFVRPAYFRFHRRAQEPIVRSTPARVQFAITPTIIIPNLNDLRLDHAEIFSYIESPSPITTVNPLAFASTDLIVERTVAEFFVDRSANQIEELYLESNFFIINFIQYTICDFGLKPS